jgi:hypothetical protein
MSLFKIELRMKRGDYIGPWSVSCGKRYKSIRRVLQAIRDMKKSWYGGRSKFGDETKWIQIYWDFRPIHHYETKE